MKKMCVNTLATGFISRLHCPLVDGRRQSFKAPDGATVTYDIYQPIEEHPGGGELEFSSCELYICLILSLGGQHGSQIYFVAFIW